MAYSIELTKRATRALAALPARERKRVGRKIEALREDPRPAGCRKIQGEEDLYRVRAGDYRIVYRVEDDVLRVLVILVGHRRQVFEDLRRLLGS